MNYIYDFLFSRCCLKEKQNFRGFILFIAIIAKGQSKL